MSDTTEAYEADIAYLHSKIKATWEQEEAFCEKVAIMVVDGHIDDNKARELAYMEIFGD